MSSDCNKLGDDRPNIDPIAVNSTFEFTVEHIASYDGDAIAFGLITKGMLCEGYRLVLLRDEQHALDCSCKAIAGASVRLMQATADSPNRNVGIWLDIKPSDLRREDRLISFDNPSSAHEITPSNWQFSILGGVKK